MHHCCLNKYPEVTPHVVKLENRTPYFAIRPDAILTKAVDYLPQWVQQSKRQRNTPTSLLQLTVNLSAFRQSSQEHSRITEH